jgi:hypothetical protein
MEKKPSKSGIELIKDKKALFDAYRLVTLRLKEALHKKDLKDIKACIANRQQMVKRIDRIDQTLQKGTNEVPKNQKTAHDYKNKNTDILYKSMEQVIHDISVLDKDCMKIATTERDLLKNQLLGYQQSKRGTKGYQSGNAAPAKFIDTMIR